MQTPVSELPYFCSESTADPTPWCEPFDSSVLFLLQHPADNWSRQVDNGDGEIPYIVGEAGDVLRILDPKNKCT
jgi:hypothetical protein